MQQIVVRPNGQKIILPSTFKVATPLGIPQTIQPKGRPNTRFQLGLTRPMLLKSDFYKKKALFVPSECTETNAIQGTMEFLRERQIMMILKTIVPNKIDCMIWAGAKRGGWPCVSLHGKMRGAMKTLVGWLTDTDMEMVPTRKICHTDFCINPSHHYFENFPYNISVDADLVENIYGVHVEPGEEKIYWRTNQVYPWARLDSQEEPLEEITEELLWALEHRKSLTLLRQDRISTKNAIRPEPGQSMKEFFKITPKNSEAGKIHIEEQMEEKT